MKNVLLLIIFAVSLGLTIPSNAQNVSAPTPMDFGPREDLTIVSSDMSHVFSVEIADTQPELGYGMMFRKNVPLSEGMLFEFGEERIVSIWMKNTSVSLDVIFVRADGRILKIEHSAKPHSLRSMTSEAPVTAVFEIAGGQANALGIRPGDILQHGYFTTSP